MSRWALAALAIAVVAGIAAIPAPEADAGQQAGSTVAYLSSEAILRQTPGYAQAESTFNAEMASYRTEIERLQQQLDSASSAFDQQSIVLSPSARQERMQELRQMQEQFQTRYQELQNRMQTRRDELVAPLEDRIQRVIDGLRAERNLRMIFDLASPANNIISADPSLDLTNVVVQRLNTSGQ